MGLVTLFLCGDVMTGRGIDQILPHPSKPELHEPYARSAIDYVELAERATGPIARPVGDAYIWGDASAELDRVRPAARIVNLETAVTARDDAWPNKPVHHRMHPDNVGCLTAAKLDCCVLANNHVMDWGPAGLLETLASLQRAGVRTAGAGPDADAAAAPAIISLPARGRVLVFGFASADSGVPIAWAAAQDRPGINLLKDLSARSVGDIARQVAGFKRGGDIVVASIHWGANWRYEIASAERDFAHGLIDAAQVDIVHGHSSHHAKGIEVYRDKLILYGCGDFIDDYEGVHGREAYRADLGMMYFPSVDATTGKLVRLTMTPTRTRGFRVNRAADDEAAWLQAMLNREGRRLGTSVVSQEGGRLLLRWG